jgi:DEAD/DEAH box helicase domain-containing protein
LGGEVEAWDPGEWSLRRWLLKWGASNRKLRIFAPGTVLQSLGDEERSDLATIGEADEMELCIEASSSRPEPPGLIAEVSGPSRSVRWAVTNRLAKAPNALWGATGSEDRIVRIAASQPLVEPAGPLVSFATVRKPPAGSLTELRILHELDGSSKDLGRQFWRLLNTKVPELGRRLAAKRPLAQIEYEDRYLRSPLHVKILFEILSAALTDGKAPRVAIRTESPRSSYYARDPQYIADDWQSPSDRRAVCEALLRTLAGNVHFQEMPKSDLKHQRELRLAWNDGPRWTVRLDEGVGWLKPSRWTEFAFHANANAQAETLRSLTLNLETRNNSGTVFYLFPISK